MQMLTRLATILAMTAATASAGLIMTFDANTLYGEPGDTLTFRAAFANDGSERIYLGTDSILFNGTGFTVVDLFGNSPIYLDPGQTFPSVDILQITLDNPFTGNWGANLGKYQISGGPIPDVSQDLLASPTFDVEAVPEPSTAYLWAPALGGLLFCVRGRRHRKRV